MTRILCDFTQKHNESSNYCKHRNTEGECTKTTVHIKNGDEGYALFEACCQDFEIGDAVK